MMRFRTETFAGTDGIDAWLTSLIEDGKKYVKVVGYLYAPPMHEHAAERIIITAMVADRGEGAAAKKTLVESQPEEFEEPSIQVGEPESGREIADHYADPLERAIATPPPSFDAFQRRKPF